MGGEKFISRVKEIFGIEVTQDESKKKAVRELLKKLKLRKISLKQTLKNECDVVQREILKDSIGILKKQIKKGKDILDD